MFDLDKSIAEWRKQMLAAGIKTPVLLEELESHLREEIARQMQSGLNAQHAFEYAARKIGQAPEIKGEFKKIDVPMKMQQIIKLAGVICVVVALLCPLFVFLPFISDHGLSLMTKMLGVALYAAIVTAIILSWKYNHKFLPIIHNQPLRRSIGIVCYAGGLIWMRFGIFHLTPGGLHPRSYWLVLVVFALEWTAVAILGGVGYGLEKAARGQDTATVV